nr:MAG TPA: hypothetical protein [Caudoviricetes sp.]
MQGLEIAEAVAAEAIKQHKALRARIRHWQILAAVSWGITILLIIWRCV